MSEIFKEIYIKSHVNFIFLHILNIFYDFFYMFNESEKLLFKVTIKSQVGHNFISVCISFNLLYIIRSGFKLFTIIVLRNLWRWFNINKCFMRRNFRSAFYKLIIGLVNLYRIMNHLPQLLIED